MPTRFIIITLIVLTLVTGGLYFWEQNNLPPTNNENVVGMKQYANTVYGLSFSYPATYVLNETEAPGSALRKHHIITLIRTEDLPLPVDGEGPPAITVNIYQNNLDNQTTEKWIRGSNASNFKLGDDILASTTIGGLPALSFRWSGLYDGTTIALARPDWIYAFTVTYFEMGAPIVQDFVTIRDSVKIYK